MPAKKRAPRAVRPTSPPGYWSSRPVPWAWARERLVAARNYWIATVSPSGVPHTRPVWGVWLDDERLYFDTGSRIGTHLERNAELTVHLESADEVVIVEGTAKRVRDKASTARFLRAYNPKYLYDLAAPPGALFVVTPRVAFGWLSDPTGLDKGALFGSTGTRWEFD